MHPGIKIIFIFVLTILFCLSLSAQNYQEVCGFRIKSDAPDFDGYSIVHSAGGGLSYAFFRMIGAKNQNALLLSICSGFLYELFIDGKQNYLIEEPDPEGADLIGDPTWWAFGSGFVCMLDICLKIDRRISLSCGKNNICLRFCFG